MAKATVKNGRLKLEGVTLSFPNVFKPTSFEEGQQAKYSASFMIPKEGNEKVHDTIKEIVDGHMAENKITKALPNDNVFFIDGDDTDREEYAGHWIVKSKNKTRPAVVNRDRTPIYEEDGIIYGGCIVNAFVDTYYYKHASGKKYILGSLKGIQWVDEGTPFGDAPLSGDAFDELDDDDDI